MSYIASGALAEMRQNENSTYFDYSLKKKTPPTVQGLMFICELRKNMAKSA